MKKKFTQSAIALFIGVTMMVSSCSKECDHDAQITPSSGTNATARNRIKQMIKKLPMTKIIGLAGRYAATHPNGIVGGKTEGGWSFSNPGVGTLSFSSPDGITYSDTKNTIYAPWSSFGSNSSSGGTVVAGGSSLDMNYTFCFSSSDAAYGLNLFDLDSANFTGLSIVIGVSGDFDALANADSTTNLFDYFHGLAFYIVYDSPASGDYEVVNWLDGLAGYNINSKIAFAYLFDFRDGKLYLSTEGNMNVTGGYMNFNGKYLEIAGFFDDDQNFDWNNLTFSIVPGFGAMGCN